jgi:hypothetical protein
VTAVFVVQHKFAQGRSGSQPLAQVIAAERRCITNVVFIQCPCIRASFNLKTLVSAISLRAAIANKKIDPLGTPWQMSRR